ncbi:MULTISPECIES: glycoside hydrolase family 3 C-terminal domain-containing protein [unclassified Leifsonia]|uniref:beta-glucosidase n=1 Tax=unclassified Leifsonia TaxID=2663824 RepID=UPI0008A7DABE|nr:MULTISPECIES: glycoside hydrolase family 3 C-terminal domain-containing protein [unclassified Leifsonia]SEI14590.1 beta-glucosidase [Leifsonia sp. CL154]SFM02166.1 beta-glucosidase [Leifsonia sp. CL147]
MKLLTRRPKRVALGLAIGLTAATALTVAAQPAIAANPPYPWFDTSKTPSQRADLLLGALTFDQKIDFALWLQYPYPPPDSARPSFAAQYGIPDPRPHDSPNGVFYTIGVTQFPAEQTLAASFDPTLAKTYGQAVAQELRGKGYNGWLGPGLDLARNPLSGRLAGNPGEDPELAGQITTNMVEGAQSQNITTVLKHYVGNLQETGRFGSPAVLSGPGNPSYNDVIDERTLRELYMEPFRQAIQNGGATTIMCSYQKINGTNTCDNSAILSVPKNEWGFQGNIVPDFVGAYHDALTAVNAGVDVTGDPPPGVPPALTRDDFTSGRVSAARLDDMLRRTLYSYFASGLFDHPVGAAQDDVSTPEHVALAKTIAQDGTVLLKNDGGKKSASILPLKQGQSIGVIGRAQGDAVTIEGGSDFVLPNGPTTTALQAITARANGSPVSFSQGTVGDSPLPPIPANVLTPSSGTGNGLTATYYPNHDWTGTPAAVRNETTFDFTGSPVANLGNQWSVKYTGTITPTESGRFDFSLNPQGTGRLYIDGKLVTQGVDEAQVFLGGQPYVYTGNVQLQAGHPVSIEADYSVGESLFGPAFKMGWQPPSQSKIAAAVALAKTVDVPVVFVGQGSGEGMDRSTLALGGDQDALISAVAQANPNTVVVLSTPGPVLMPWLDNVAGVIQAGYQGQQFGPAIASVLYGDINPGGHLVMTYPKDATQGQATQPNEFPGTITKVVTDVTPSGAYEYQSQFSEGIYMGYKFYDKYNQTPLFPFGYGLSYTSFRYGKLQTVATSPGKPSSVQVQVTNTGSRAGDTVVQVYTGLSPQTKADTPAKRLAGFQRVSLEPGQTKTVTIALDSSSWSYWDTAAHTWVTPTGPVKVYAGSSERDVEAQAVMQVR